MSLFRALENILKGRELFQSTQIVDEWAGAHLKITLVHRQGTSIYLAGYHEDDPAKLVSVDVFPGRVETRGPTL